MTFQHRSVILIFLCILFLHSIYAQQKEVEFRVSESQAILLGKTSAVRDLVHLNATSKEKKAIFKKNKKVPSNFKNRRGANQILRPDLEHQGVDPVRQTQSRMMMNDIEPLVNIDGIGNFGSPHDPSGDIGIDYYVQAVNVTQVGVFNKDGSLVTQFAMNTLWSELNASSAGDPIILFDEDASRWMITEFTDPANLLIAISETSDPLGSYFAYSFSTPSFPDYPKYGIWPNAYTVTTNEGGAGVLHQYFLDRNAMLAGEPVVSMQRVEIDGNNNTEAGFFVSTPVDWNGARQPVSADPIVLALNDSSWGATPEDAVEIYTFDVDFNNPNNTVVANTTLVTTPYDANPCSATGFGFQCAPQLGGGGLDALPELITNIPHYRNFGTHESIVYCHITDVTDGDNLSGIRWVELRRTQDTDWLIHQEGTYAPDDGLDRYMCSIAMDARGNIGLGYNISSNDTYVGVRYTGRYANDPLGMMTVNEYNVVDGTNTINSGGRFGDYSQMSVDPINGSTFWFLSEYGGNGGSNSLVRVVSFELSRDTTDLAVTSLDRSSFVSSDLGAEESIVATITNAGIDTMFSFDISFDFNGTFVETMSVQDTLASGESKTYEFEQTVDMSQLGDYVVKIYGDLDGDENATNDTLIQVLSKILSIDAGITADSENQTCAEEAIVSVSLSNSGDQPMTSATIEIMVNGTLVQTEDWTGNLGLNDRADVEIAISGLVTGENTVTVTILNVNGIQDANATNDSAEIIYELLDPEGSTTININTDEYPDETSWEITDQNGDIVAAQGPFSDELSLSIADLCLVVGECYTFTIFDTYGDGICCDFGVGNYEILDDEGIVIVSSTGEFGFSESQIFCVGVECNLTADVTTTNASGANTADGVIMIEATGGNAPFAYSIDGGDTFEKSNVFMNLTAGDYDIIVQDADGFCSYSETITVDFTSSLDDIEDLLTEIIVSPNPGQGYYTIQINNTRFNDPFLNIQILDRTGKLVQTRRIGKYDDSYVATISLLEYPNGIYFIRYMHSDMKMMSKVIKVD